MWSPKTLTPEQQQERRLTATRLLQSGQLTQGQVAREIGVSRQSVSRWAQQLTSVGGQALCRRPHTGRNPSLSVAQWQTVLTTLRAGAQASGFPTERWTLARIQSVISGRFGVRYNAHYLSERLHALGWSVQVPEVTARERNEALVQAWLRDDWPRIKKKRIVKERKSPSWTRSASRS